VYLRTVLKFCGGYLVICKIIISKALRKAFSNNIYRTINHNDDFINYLQLKYYIFFECFLYTSINNYFRIDTIMIFVFNFILLKLISLYIDFGRKMIQC